MKNIFLLCVLTLPCYAQASYPPYWTLDDCMEYAVENNIQKKQQEYTQANQKITVMEAVANALPSLSASGSTRWSFGRSIDPADNTYSTTSNFNNSYSMSASITLFNGFVLINNIRSSMVARERGKESMKKIVDDICLNTIEAFFDVVYSMEMVSITEAQLEQSRNDFHRTEKYVELGLKSLPDLTQIEAQVASSEYSLTRQRNALQRAELNLKKVMNYPIDQQLEILAPSERELFSNLGYDPDHILRSVLELPQVKMADYNLRESELAFSIAKGRQYPSLSASGGFSTNFYRNLQRSGSDVTPFRRQLRNNEGKSISLSLSIPIFGGLSRRSNIARSRNSLQIARQENIAVHRDIIIQAEQAMMDFEGFLKEAAQSEKKMVSYHHAHQVNQNKFDQGLISALELETSSNQLLSARADHLNSRLQLILQKRLLEYYSGEPLLKTKYE